MAVRTITLRRRFVLGMFTPIKWYSPPEPGYWRFTLTHKEGNTWLADLGLSDVGKDGSEATTESLAEELKSWLYDNVSSSGIDKYFPMVKKALESLVEEYRSSQVHRVAAATQ